MPLKVAIIEDNPVTLRSLLETIDWPSLDCEVMGTAMNGESGRQMLLRIRPDIVLTDICMSQKSGLDMIEDVRPELPRCKMIIITGYDQFQYASRAIKMSVFDYLLKPIKNEEVADTVRRAADVLRREREVNIELEQGEAAKRRAQLLLLLTNDSQRDQGIGDLLSEVGLHFCTYYIMILQTTPERGIQQAELNLLDGALAQSKAKTVTVLLYDTIVVFVMRDVAGGAWIGEAKEISDRIRKAMKTPVNIGVSLLGSSRHKIREAYQQARQALWEIALQQDPKGCGFYQEDQSHLLNERVSKLYQSIDRMIEKSDLSDAYAAEAAAEAARQSGQQYSNLRAIVSLYSIALRKKYPCPSNEEISGALCAIWFVSNESDARECLTRLCRALRAEQEKPEDEKQSLLTRTALQYVNLHAIEALRLDEVAEKLRVSSKYLSALVRKETGVTFHEHVLIAKMCVARTMLADPRVLVDEVARAVGYGNYISFYNAFKRVEHMTPTEYRNRMVDL